MVYSNNCCCLQQPCFARNTSPTSQRFQTTDVTTQDYPAQFIDFQRGQHQHSSNMKYQATSSPTATHVVNDQSNFKQPTHTLPSLLSSPEFLQPYLYPRNFTTRLEIQGHTTCPNLTACKNNPHTSEQFINTPAQHIGARQIDVHQAKYHDKRRELLAQVS